MIRAAVVVGLILASMVAIKDDRTLRHARIVSSCHAVAAPRGDTGFWAACRPGRLEGRPNLRRNACESRGIVANVEYWRCPARLDSGADAVAP